MHNYSHFVFDIAAVVVDVIVMLLLFFFLVVEEFKTFFFGEKKAIQNPMGNILFVHLFVTYIESAVIISHKYSGTAKTCPSGNSKNDEILPFFLHVLNIRRFISVRFYFHKLFLRTSVQ